jgi:hypothetical protein
MTAGGIEPSASSQTSASPLAAASPSESSWKAAPTDPADDPNARVVAESFLDHRPGPIRRIITHDDDLGFGQYRMNLTHQPEDGFSLAVSRKNYGDRHDFSATTSSVEAATWLQVSSDQASDRVELLPGEVGGRG